MFPENKVPTIETERLTLRRHCLDDFAPSSAMWGDSNVVRYISGNPSSAQQSWMRVLNYVGHWSLMGFGYWVVERSVLGDSLARSDSPTLSAVLIHRSMGFPK